jgi:S-adenosylmethionine:tRNA ribosyltransferase-isomerase
VSPNNPSTQSILRTSDFDYYLPIEYIAQTPVEPRDSSRLLVLDRQSGEIEHKIFKEVGNCLSPGDTLIINETKVIPARLYGRKIPTGGKVELLLIRQEDTYTWETLVGGKGVSVGKQIYLENRKGTGGDLQAEVIAELDGARRLVRFNDRLEDHLAEVGHVPLPPYIRQHLDDPERYQTVYARHTGSVAAPTAGLHFTDSLIDKLIGRGINFAKVTLHVGLDTFAPVTEDDPGEHRIHTEWCQVTQETADLINLTRQSGGRVIAVGTTSVRTLETAARGNDEKKEIIKSFEGTTDLFILPGFSFRVVDGLITNFHLPRSTLIMLVSAFTGRKCTLNAYDIAIKENYRFYSFGDAMLIL